MTRTRTTVADIEGSEIESQDLAARIAVNPHHIEGEPQNILKQSVNIDRTQEVEEEIGIQRTIKDPGAVIRETEIKDVTVLAQVDHILRTVQEEKLDLHLEKSHEVLPAVHNRINQRLIQRKAKS